MAKENEVKGYEFPLRKRFDLNDITKIVESSKYNIWMNVVERAHNYVREQQGRKFRFAGQEYYIAFAGFPKGLETIRANNGVVPLLALPAGSFEVEMGTDMLPMGAVYYAQEIGMARLLARQKMRTFKAELVEAGFNVTKSRNVPSVNSAGIIGDKLIVPVYAL